MLQGLKGNEKSVESEGNVTPDSLGNYVYKEIVNLPPDRRPKQKPIRKTEASGEIILAYYPDLKPTRIEVILASLSKLLYDGNIEEFNKKRDQLPTNLLNFSQVNLHATNLSKANLSNVNMSRADLSNADLEGADLSNANLFRADIEGAYLHEANFSNADLSKANLSNADLSNADLSNSNLFGAYLKQAKVIGAKFFGSNLSRAKLDNNPLLGAIFEQPVASSTAPVTQPSSSTAPVTQPPSFDSRSNVGSISNISKTRVEEKPAPIKKSIKKSRLLLPVLVAATAVGIMIVLIILVPIYLNGYSFKEKWGSFGSNDGQFNTPSGISVDFSGGETVVYVTDSGNNRVQEFSRDGTFITKWGSSGSGNGQFNMFHRPSGIAVDSSGPERDVYVTDPGTYRVQKFSSDGTFITNLGSFGSFDGEFTNPMGVALDSAGNMYVSDTSNNNVQVFHPNK